MRVLGIRRLVAFAAQLALAQAAVAQDVGSQDVGAPLSAIDWLSQSVEQAGIGTNLPPVAAASEPPVAESAATPEVSVSRLDAPSADLVGLLPGSVTGLPRDLWSASPEAALTDLIAAERAESLPALQDLRMTLMLAEADPPLDAGPAGALFLARIDTLLDLGALEPAQAMLETTDGSDPEVFRRWFDVSLLTGSEHEACRMMAARPSIAPTYPARIFCLAREGAWTDAALTLATARALGDVTAEEDALLSRFLDTELFEGEPPLPQPSRISPLVFRMHEAIGEALPTANLPRAFAHADLRPTVAWRSQIEAAERLARVGAVSENILLAAYTARVPAASGGVWDRAKAVQALDRALMAGDAAAVADALPPAFAAMRNGRTEVAFARMFGTRLAALTLPPSAADLAFEIALLTPEYEVAALSHAPANPRTAFLQGVARGDLTGLMSATPAEAAVADAFGGAMAPPEPMAGQIATGRLGEALLRAMATFNQGLAGDPRAVSDALTTLRAIGLEDAARRAALQYLILERSP